MEKTDVGLVESLRTVHASLLEDLRKLGEAVKARSGEGPAELAARLTETHAHLTEHFRFEEENGYMDTVREREPRLERAIEHLAEEHRQLKESLEMLLTEARIARAMEAAFRTRVREWVKRVRQHEVRENELIEDAFNLDLGAED